MSREILTTKTLALSAAFALCAAGAGAQAREVFQWSGPVDREVQIVMRGRALQTNYETKNDVGFRRTLVTNPLPRIDGEITLRVANGRGTVDVVQQPTAANNYTAIIRVRDAASGSDRYRINAFWQPSSAGEVAGPPYGRGRGRGRQDAVYPGAGYPSNRYPGTTSRVALQWSGEVDDRLNIRLRGSAVEYQTLQGMVPKRMQTTMAALPPSNLRLVVNQTEGRGDVFVAQQPTAANGYTAIIRVSDPQKGYGRYSFTVTW